MESYNKFIERIGYQRPEPEIGGARFIPDKERVFPKVGEDKRFRPFYGDTTVFELSSETKRKISALEDKIYNAASECFAQRLPSATFHMTLHDLSAGECLDEVAPECFENEIRLRRLADMNEFPREKISMRTNYIVNMVSTSLVMALVPEDEGEWNKLEGLYRLIDGVRKCPYPYLTPHITLAYFNRGGFDAATADRLEEVIRGLNGLDSFHVELDTEKLVYQKFLSMADYVTIFGLV